MIDLPHPPTDKPCPNCGGKRTIVRVQTIQGYLLRLVQTKRTAGLFSGRSNKSYLGAFACTRCGYTTLFALQPSDLIPDQE